MAVSILFTHKFLSEEDTTEKFPNLRIVYIGLDIFSLDFMIFRRVRLIFAGLECFCGVCCTPRHHTLIHKGTHKGGAAAEGGRPPFVEAAEGRLLFG